MVSAVPPRVLTKCPTTTGRPAAAVAEGAERGMRSPLRSLLPADAASTTAGPAKKLARFELCP